MKADSSPKCGSAGRTPGKIYQAGTMNDIRFKPDEASVLSLKERVIALACSKCGYIEFFLSEHESENS